jgi:iron complex transport system substrate-binding protein
MEQKDKKNILVNLILLLYLYCIPTGCRHDQSSVGDSEPSEENRTSYHVNIQFAEGFKIDCFSNYKKITVFNPWQGADNINYEYLLIKRGEKIPDGLTGYPVIETPVEKVICFSTTHIAMIDLLNKTHTILGISGKELPNNPLVRKGINDGKIKDVGYEQNLNFENIISLNPDIIMTYGINSEIAGFILKLKELGLNVVMNAEYLEKDPLAKLEWIKFVGAFYDKEQDACNMFKTIVAEYDSVKNLVSSKKRKPKVMIGLPWKDVWYIPGGKSFAARFIKDAGGEYIWKDIDSKTAQPMDFETIYQKAKDADIWINPGDSDNLEAILSVDARLEYFQPFKNSKVYNNNAIVNEFGGNDYWESGIIRPHIILKDLVRIFHPEVLPDHELVYYKNICDYP